MTGFQWGDLVFSRQENESYFFKCLAIIMCKWNLTCERRRIREPIVVAVPIERTLD